MSELAAAYSNIVIGYSGCDEGVGNAALASPSTSGLVASNNGYDWLGTGIYFWENDPVRAFQWAVEAKERHLERNKKTGAAIRIRSPFVVGAVIQLGTCLDLTTREGVELIKKAHVGFMIDQERIRSEHPEYRIPENTKDDDMKGRYLDFQVINYACQEYATTSHQTIDTVRSFFHEGEPIYPGAGFQEKTHIQICVREPSRSIRGYFRVPATLEELKSRIGAR